MFDHAPFYWEPEGFKSEDEVATWLTICSAEGVSVEVERGRAYFRSLEEVQYAVELAADTCQMCRMDHQPTVETGAPIDFGAHLNPV